MKKVLDVRGVRIGEGRPKIIVPIVGNDRKAIIDKAKSFENLPIDIVEWRVDFFEDVFDVNRVLDTLNELRKSLNNTPILFTFRTKNEGGEREITPEDYTKLNEEIAASGLVDLIDVEIFTNMDNAMGNIKRIHSHKILVVGSNHDFDKTPSKNELVDRLIKMQELDVDIPKIAVMPNSSKDVLELLSATEEMYTKYADRPIVTMSMAATGLVSRLTGESFGSSMTFGAVGQVSAPGQIPVEKLELILNIINESM